MPKRLFHEIPLMVYTTNHHSACDLACSTHSDIYSIMYVTSWAYNLQEKDWSSKLRDIMGDKLVEERVYVDSRVRRFSRVRGLSINRDSHMDSRGW